MKVEVATNIGLSDQEREGVLNILGLLLADEYVVYTKTRSYHWNVVGPQFNDLHRFFQAQYEDLNEVVDEVAERARTLGGWALGTLGEFLQNTRLEERPGEYADARTMIVALMEDHEAIIRTLRTDADACDEKYRDMGTNDFLIGLMERHEKMAWMLRAFLAG